MLRYLLLTVVLLLIISLYFLYPIFRAVRISKGIQQNTVAYEQHPANPAFHVLVAGDSTAFGTGAATPEGSTAGRIGQDFPTADIRNIAQYGDTLSELNMKLSAQDDTSYDLILLQIGANDVTGMTSYADIQSELTRALDFAEAHASSVIVLTAGDIGSSPVFKYPLSSHLTRRTLHVRDLFMQVIAKRDSVTYIDLYEDPTHNTFNEDIPKYYAPDRFHPSSDGYGLWYQSLGPVVRQVLGN